MTELRGGANAGESRMMQCVERGLEEEKKKRRREEEKKRGTKQTVAAMEMKMWLSDQSMGASR